jgi:formylglycine-generating enzyme required for sulfatase activity
MTPAKTIKQRENYTISIILHALEVDARSRNVEDAPVLSEAVSEFRSYFHSHYPSVDLAALDKGTFRQEKEKIAMQLRQARADRDVELLLKVMQFNDALLAQPKESADVIGVNLQDVQANTVTIQDVIVHVHKTDEPPAPGEEPYKGLQYFDVADSELFFGRAKLTAQLVDHLRGHSFLAVIGASGSGKSSLVRAGLVSALQKGEKLDDGSLPPKDSENWSVLILTPTSRPLENLAEQFIRKFNLGGDGRTLANEMNHDPRTFLHIARQALDSQDSEENLHPARCLVLVIDQFEELFTLLRSDDQQKSIEIHKIRQSYIDNLLYAAIPSDQRDRSDSRIIVIFTLRADFYDQCGKFENLRKAFESHQKYIGPMSQDELRQAIEKPLQSFDWNIQPGLVDLLVYDVGKEPGALPLLSHALLETWKQRSGRTLTFSGYFAIGRVQGAIAETAESTFQELTAQQQRIAKKIFLRLTEISQNMEATRRRVALSELVAEPSEQPIVKNILDLLAAKRLITLNKDFSDQASTETPGEYEKDENEESVVEVAHEALIREWPTLQTWLRENGSELRIHRSLTRAAEQWDERKRDRSVLYRGGRLSEALEWAKQNGSDMNILERKFLSASRRAMWLNRAILGITLILITTAITLGVTGQLNRLIYQPLPYDFERIPAGQFMMGIREDEIKMATALDTTNKGNPDNKGFGVPVGYDLSQEKPPHLVTLTSPYGIGRYEVTNKQYRQCVKARVCSPPFNDQWPKNDELPVTGVNRYQARTFCSWMGARLPTEAEWERAALGSHDGPQLYPWGNENDPQNANVNDGDQVKLLPVGTFSGKGDSPYHVEDLAGNASEWVIDGYSENYENAGKSDPQGLQTGLLGIVRGGSYYSNWIEARSTARRASDPGSADLDVGIRCAR